MSSPETHVGEEEMGERGVDELSQELCDGGGGRGRREDGEELQPEVDAELGDVHGGEGVEGEEGLDGREATRGPGGAGP